jgi:hypothetical protein
MKFLTISMIIMGIILIFNFGGVTTPVGGYATRFYDGLSSDENPLSNIKNDPLVWVALVAIVVAVGAVGVRAGLIGSAPPISYYTGTFVVIGLGGLILTDIITIMGKLWEYGESWMRAIVLLIFIPLTFAYILALKSFWEGTDY